MVNAMTVPLFVSFVMCMFMCFFVSAGATVSPLIVVVVPVVAVLIIVMLGIVGVVLAAVAYYKLTRTKTSARSVNSGEKWSMQNMPITIDSPTDENP